MDQRCDRNLLLGILALQNDLVTRDQLIEALNAWTLAKDRPLGEILCERGALDREHGRLLEQLLDAHVRRHGSVERSLADCEPTSSVRSALEHVADADVQATLTVLQQPREPDVKVTSSSAKESRSGSRLSVPNAVRYRVLRPHAKGGLGEVFVAEDLELHREVALKEIQRQHADQDSNRGRFVLEAEITGGLEHPGIVPVYGLGTYADGRPFYAMRFIKGDNLKQATDQFHQSGACFDSSVFRQLLGRFIDVCNAVAYAHSRGVLHRDLKPGNIMLGRFGETLVVDWGLAKVVGRAESSGNELTLVPASGSGVAETMHGTAIGTPAFMSPEQASGRVAELGPATDVYSLGATLYALLTNRPPIEEDNLAMVLHKVQSGDIPRPRYMNAAIPKPLEAICLRAMSRQPSERYATALELASDLEHWLAEEPVSAFSEPISVRTRRWLRKHPKSVTAVAATVLVGVTSLTAIALVVTNKNQQLAQANGDLQLANAAERRATREADAKRQEAETARNKEQQARKDEEEARNRAEAVSQYLVNAFRKPDPSMDGREVKVADVLDQAVKQLDEDFKNQPLVKSELLHAIGTTYQGLGIFDQAIVTNERAYQLNKERLGKDHEETILSLTNLGLAYHSAGRYDKSVPIAAECLARTEAKWGQDHRETRNAMNNLGSAYDAVGRYDKALPLLERVLEINRRLEGEDDPDTLMAMSSLGVAYFSAGQSEKGLPVLKECFERRRAVLSADHPLTLLSMGNLAQAYEETNHFEESMTLSQEVYERKRAKLGEDHPDTLTSMNNVAMNYWSANQPDKATPMLERCVMLMKAKCGESNRETLIATANLALIYEQTGRLGEALQLYEQVFNLACESLGEDHPRTVEALDNLLTTLEAAKEYGKVITMYEERLAHQSRTFGDDHPDTLKTMEKLVRVRFLAGKTTESLLLLDKLTGLKREKAQANDPQFADYLARTALQLLAHAQYSAAEHYVRECLAIRETVLPDEWRTFNTKSMLGGALIGQAKQLQATDAAVATAKFTEAEPFLVQGYDGMRQCEAAIPPEGKIRLTEALSRLVDLYTAWGKPDEA
jgi:serine/threonine protein kinase